MKTWTVDDVMTKAVVSVKHTASYRSLVDLLVSRRFSAVRPRRPQHGLPGLIYGVA